VELRLLQVAASSQKRTERFAAQSRLQPARLSPASPNKKAIACQDDDAPNYVDDNSKPRQPFSLFISPLYQIVMTCAL
jgi:hypothetical protein